MGKIIYYDYDYDLPKTANLDFGFIENYEAIQQSIKTIIMTKRGARTKFQNPYFGSNVHKLLFEKMTLFTTIQIKNEIALALDLWEPRIKIIQIDVISKKEDKLYNINIQYEIIDLNIEDELVLSLGIIK